MATWIKKDKPARKEALRKWRKENAGGTGLDRKTYWIQRRLRHLINDGVIVPEVEEDI